tara:strand:+ start:353 stop:1603 length:1251 start_codon:yes stop_codon:yes gene_type:complete
LKIINRSLLISLPFALISGPALPDIIIVLIGLIFLIQCFKKRDWSLFKKNYSIIFLIWNLYIILISLSSDNIYLSLESSLFYFRFGIFALAVFNIIDNDEKILKYFFWSLFSALLLVSIDAWLQFFNGKNLIGYTYNNQRLNGLFGEEFVLGSFLSRLFPLFFGLAIHMYYRSKIVVICALLLFLSIDCLIFVSGERSAFLYLILSTLVILLLTRRWKIIRLSTFIFSMIILIFVSIYNPSAKKRMVDQTLNQTNILKDNIVDMKFNIFSVQHEVIYKSASKIFLDNKFFGIGPKMFREVCQQKEYQFFVDEDRSVNGCQLHPHNSYLQLLTETGVVGFIPVFLLLILILKRFVNHSFFIFTKNANHLLSDYQINLYACLLITLFPFVPTGNFFGNWINVIYFLPIGFLLHTYKKN